MTREELEKIRKNQELSDLKTVLSTPEGRRFIYRKIKECGAFGLSFSVGQPDVTAFNEGAKSFGINLMAEITSELPELFFTMQREAIEYERRIKEENDRVHKSGDDDRPAFG